MQDFRRFLSGIIYFWMWNSSIFAGYLLFCSLIPCLTVAPKFYRRIVDFVITFWQFYVTTLLTIRWGCTIQVTGDAIDSEETSILISNHRSRVDWNFLWPAMFHAVQGPNKIFCSTKFILKQSIKNIPGAGWVMQLAFYLFIHRNWNKDQRIIKNYINYVSDMTYKHVMIMFPEGTDLTCKTKEISDKYAESNGLPKYKNVLHPRTTGFTYLIDQMKKMKCVDAVYDVTLIYPDDCPQNEEELFFQGKFPKKVIAHFVRYPVATLPDTKEGLKEFLKQRWIEKEKTIEEFKSTGRFLHGKVLYQDVPPIVYLLTFFFWSGVPFGGFYLLSVNRQYLCIVVLHTLLLLMLQRFPIGFQSYDMFSYNTRKFLFGKRNNQE